MQAYEFVDRESGFGFLNRSALAYSACKIGNFTPVRQETLSRIAEVGWGLIRCSEEHTTTRKRKSCETATETHVRATERSLAGCKAIGEKGSSRENQIISDVQFQKKKAGSNPCLLSRFLQPSIRSFCRNLRGSSVLAVGLA